MCLWPRLPEGAVSGILDRTPVLCLSLQSGSLCAAAEAVSALNCSRDWTQRTQLPCVVATAEEYELEVNVIPCYSAH